MKQILSLLLPCFFLVTAYSQEPAFKQVNSKEFNTLIKKSSGTLLDVRTQGEFKNGHIARAGQLNYYALDFRKKLLLLPRDQPVYLYCNTGYRSRKAAEILAAKGYKEVYNLEHGILEWNLQNLPVVVEPDAKPDTENKMEFDEFNALIQSGALVFVDFYAPWCGPCRKMMPMMDSLKTVYRERIKMVKINVDASKRLSKKLGIISVPYLVLYDNGKMVFFHNGLIERNDLERTLKDSLHK